MKYLLVLAVVTVAFWIWRNNRQIDTSGDTPRARKSAGRPTHMVACDQCGTHVPDDELVRGQRGVYCCPEHRRQAEGSAG